MLEVNENSEPESVELTIVFGLPLDYDTHRVTEATGLTPTKIWRPKQALAEKVNHIEWHHAVLLDDCTNLDDAIWSSLELVWDSRSKILKLIEEDNVSLALCLFPLGWQVHSGWYIERREIFERMAYLNASLNFRTGY